MQDIGDDLEGYKTSSDIWNSHMHAKTQQNNKYSNKSDSYFIIHILSIHLNYRYHDSIDDIISYMHGLYYTRFITLDGKLIFRYSAPFLSFTVNWCELSWWAVF